MRGDWDADYCAGDPPWDSGYPDPELVALITTIPPSRALDVGCGTGTNAVFLAQRGFDVTGCDVSGVAIARARDRARAAGVSVRFEVADLLANPDLGGPWPFVFDRGLYHVLRTIDGPAYLRWLAGVTEPGAQYLVLAGNANDGGGPGPPRVHAHELCAELQPWWDLVRLVEGWDEIVIDGTPHQVRMWSGLFRRVDRATP